MPHAHYDRLTPLSARQREQRRAQQAAEQERLLRWVLTFINDELAQPARNRRQLQQDLRQFNFVSGLFGVIRMVPVSDRRRTGARPLRHLAWPEIRQVHTGLREMMNTLKPRGAFLNAEPTYTLPNPLKQQLGSDGHRIWMASRTSWPHTIYHTVGGLLVRFGERITRCENRECQRLFLRTRRQTFCGVSCSQRVRSQRWYQTHQEQARENRRQAYARTVRARHARAKIHKRPHEGGHHR